jgi:hypothetical protein
MSLLLAILLQAPEGAPPAERRWEQMDYGPFLSNAISMPWPKGAVTPKGIVVKVGSGAICFDTDLLRYAGGWTDGWLTLLGPSFDGSRTPDAKTRPLPAGSLRFASRNIPGWIRGDPTSVPGRAEELRDPRPEPYGPLPADWAKYRGLYVNGDRVVFSYTAGGKCEVLDLPGLENGILTRTLLLGPSQDTLTILLCETPEEREAVGFPSGLELGDLVLGCVRMPERAEWKIFGKSRCYLKISSHEQPLLLKILYGKDRAPVAAAIEANQIEDPRALTRGGAARARESVETRGQLGHGGGAYEVDTLALPDENPWHSWMRVSGLDFFSDGRAAISTWSGDVWTVSGIDESLEKLRWRRVASGLFQPCGLRIVGDVVYVVARDQITRLVDLNGDGETDFYENFNNDCTEKGNYHEFAMDLHTDAEGNFYYCKGGLGANFPGGAVGAHHGCMIRVSKDGKKLDIVATGIRAGAGSGIGPHGEITVSDNDGHWGPASRINLLTKGGYYGDPYTAHLTPLPTEFEPPLCWIHRSVDNSSGDQVWVTSDRWGPFQGHMLHTSYGTCSLFQVLMDKVDGRMQGGIVRFPLTFSSGIFRSRFHPRDGQLYVAGLKGWSTSGVRDGCLQRVRYTGKPVYSVSQLRVLHTGLELSFTSPVDPETAGDVDSYFAQWWNYLYSEKYGSPDFSVAEPKKQGRDAVEIVSAKVSPDGKKVTLEIPGLRPVQQLLLRFRIKSADGPTLSQEIWYTIHKVP